MAEKRFAFRKALTTSNQPFSYLPREKTPDEISFSDGVLFTGAAGSVIRHAQEDFFDFLKVGFGVTGGVHPVTIDVKLTWEVPGDVAAYKGRAVEISDGGVTIRAFDERGAAQAIYDLEEAMLSARQPYVRKEKTKNRPLFSPRMAHSAYAPDTYPAGYLQRLAKEGVDAIILNVTGVDQTISGGRDINAMIALAVEYGLDVYAYWHRQLFHSPAAPDAAQVYDKAFGALFRAHPGLKGIIFVGENIQFPSTDPHTTGREFGRFLNEDNFPDPRPGTSHWPCEDYALWLELVKSVIRAQKPDADIVFWTYNWGWAPEADRIALIDRLPTDISLMATFEMFQNLPTEQGITERVCDYTVAFAGPGDYFTSEAKAAKRRGIRLYAQANVGGRTWDFGCLPFEPFPQQWMERYQAMRRCHEAYGLTGVMECHQYGFWPSFITKLEKRAFEAIAPPPEEILRSVIDTFSGGETEVCLQAFSLWSSAIRMYMPTDNEQYGAMRVGPAYPLVLGLFPTPPPSLMPEGSFFGNGITDEYDAPTGLIFNEGAFTPHCLRIRPEICTLRQIVALIGKGLALLKHVKQKSEELKCLINMGEYMVCCFTTDIHVKQMYLYRQRLSVAPTAKAVRGILQGIRSVGEAEIKSARRALACVDRDSAIGYEPMMGYAGDRAHIEWKIRQVEHMLTYELAVYEKGLLHTGNEENENGSI